MSPGSFHGSYDPADVTFLLKPVEIATTDVAEKERAIQSGARHYSEMLSPEKTPGKRYMSLFHQALDLNKVRFASDLASLARTLSLRPGREVVLVSLARAGTPVGVILQRALTRLGRQSVHYSVSIIRDRGIDTVALAYILERHSDRDVVFVDGWTGKGAIATELESAVGAYNSAHGVSLDSGLVVVSDLAGVAKLAVSADDYLIPSAILNSIVSGLISRTVLNSDYVGAGDFHACMFFEDKRSEDLSRMFVDLVGALVLDMVGEVRTSPACTWNDAERARVKRVSDDYVAWAMERYQVADRNRVKPGIGESTRALLRRMPDRLIVQQRSAEDIEHLTTLADEQGVPVEVNPSMPYRAAVIIKSLGE